MGSILQFFLSMRLQSHFAYHLPRGDGAFPFLIYRYKSYWELCIKHTVSTGFFICDVFEMGLWSFSYNNLFLKKFLSWYKRYAISFHIHATYILPWKHISLWSSTVSSKRNKLNVLFLCDGKIIKIWKEIVVWTSRGVLGRTLDLNHGYFWLVTCLLWGSVIWHSDNLCGIVQLFKQIGLDAVDACLSCDWLFYGFVMMELRYYRRNLVVARECTIWICLNAYAVNPST